MDPQSTFFCQFTDILKLLSHTLQGKNPEGFPFACLVEATFGDQAMDVSLVAKTFAMALEHHHSAYPQSAFLFILAQNLVNTPEQLVHCLLRFFPPLTGHNLREREYQVQMTCGDQPLSNGFQPYDLILRSAGRASATVTGVVDDGRPLATVAVYDLKTFAYRATAAKVIDVLLLQ